MHAATGGSCRDHGGSVVQLVNVQSSQSERPRRYGDLQQPLDSAGIGLQYGGVWCLQSSCGRGETVIVLINPKMGMVSLREGPPDWLWERPPTVAEGVARRPLRH